MSQPAEDKLISMPHRAGQLGDSPEVVMADGHLDVEALVRQMAIACPSSRARTVQPGNGEQLVFVFEPLPGAGAGVLGY